MLHPSFDALIPRRQIFAVADHYQSRHSYTDPIASITHFQCALQLTPAPGFVRGCQQVAELAGQLTGIVTLAISYFMPSYISSVLRAGHKELPGSVSAIRAFVTRQLGYWTDIIMKLAVGR